MIVTVVLLVALADIGAVKSEADPNRRSELALANADEKFDDARTADRDGNEKVETAAIDEMLESAELCYASLEQAPGEPRKNRAYKRAELRVSTLIRRMRDFRDQASPEFRQRIEAALAKLSDIHDKLLSDIMSKKK